MYDPNLHLFVDDTDVMARQDLYRMVHPVRRESLEPVLAQDENGEAKAIGYATVVRDEKTGLFRVWYSCHGDWQVRLAVSEDGRTWQRKGVVLPADARLSVDNLGLTTVGPDADPWFDGAQFAGFCYSKGEVGPKGLNLARCRDGEHLEIHPDGILPGVGDRSSLMLDEVSGEYSLISRPRAGMPGFRGEWRKPRVARMWKSRNLMDWDDQGIVLTYDDQDRHDTQIYGMQPFRYGQGFLALVEVYYAGMERLETQLASSADGVCWQRVGNREPVIAMGGEGAWDSFWTVSTYNPPFEVGDRLWVFYSGAGTKHGSKERHHRAVGLASIRKDGWVSLESGRTEGILITTCLPLSKPMKLEVNANCRTGYLAAEVLSAEEGKQSEALAGYEGSSGRIEYVDSVRHRITWGERNAIEPIPAGACYLRFTTQQSSFFSYRWSEA